MIAPELVRRILQRYGVEALRIHEAQTGYRSQVFCAELPSGARINLILYKREPGIVRRIRNANMVGDYAAAAGLPCRQTYDGRIITLSGTATTYGSLYSYLPGETIPWEGYTMEHLKQAGAMLGRLHGALLPMHREHLPSVIDEYRRLLSHMTAYFADEGVATALHHKLQLAVPQLHMFGALFDITATIPGTQALHMDFVRGNLLFEPGTKRLSGVLDFEKTAWGPPVYDIARTLAFLLVDCKYKPEAKIRKYFLQSGYAKRGGRQLQHDEILERLIDFNLLHDFYKFLRHNPYESLPRNEHFVRTVALLSEREHLGTLDIAPTGVNC